MRKDLLRWQLELYPEGHKDRQNPLIPPERVPIFHMGTATLLIGALTLSGVTILTGWTVMFACLILQGRGHRREATSPVPFDGPADAVSRLFVEQFVTFPRFLLSGDFVRAYRAASGR